MSWVSSTEQNRWITENNYTDEKGTEIIIGGERGKPLYGFGTCLTR